MKRCAILLLAAVVVAGCGSDAAPGNATAQFLGPEADWCRCRLILREDAALFGMRDIYLSGRGEVIVRTTDTQHERRFNLKLGAEETRLLRALCIEADLLSTKVEDRPPDPDEGRQRLILINAAGEKFEVMKLGGDLAPDFDRVSKALAALDARAERLKPVYDGPYDAKWDPAKE